MNFNLRAFLCLLALSLASCRGWVLEDRTDCPRLLYFHIGNAGSFDAGTPVEVHAVFFPSGQPALESATTVQDIQDRSFSLTVRSAGYVKGFACIGAEGLVPSGEALTLPSGKPYPSLYRFSYLSPIPEESCTVPVEMIKDHAGIRLQFIGQWCPARVRVKGNTCGIYPETGTPVTGVLDFCPVANPDGVFSFNLPRLCDEDLSLELYGEDGLRETLDLFGILLEEGGFSWTERNLPDVGLVIDREQQAFQIDVIPWEATNLTYEF